MAEYHKIGGQTKRLKTTNNYYKNPILCQFCNTPITIKDGVNIGEMKKRKFCNNDCQNKYKIFQKILKWKETGIVRPSSSSTHYLRKYLFEKQNGKCLICQNYAVWLNNPINFIIDHIDGNYRNNLENNLRLICPNCDSQLPTFKGRNKGNGREYRRK